MAEDALHEGDKARPTDWDVNRQENARRMIIAEPLWVTASRTTHVDVMCTSNTVRRYVPPGEKERKMSKSKAHCRLPYASNASAASVKRNSATATPTQRLMDEITRKKMNEAMHEERRVFMTRLVRERDAKAETEYSGASLLQAAWRGASIRRSADEEIERPRRGGKRPESDDDRRARLRKEKLQLDDEIRAELVALAEKAGLAPVVNVSLDNDKMKAYKQQLERDKEEQRLQACRLIQERARIRQAKLRALGVIGVLKSYTSGDKAIVIQQSWKRHLTRGWHEGRKREAAALLVQSRWRRMVMVRRFVEASREVLRRRREEGAALRVQCAYRRRASQLHVGGLARAMIRAHEASHRLDEDRQDFSQHLKWQDDDRRTHAARLSPTRVEADRLKEQWRREASEGAGGFARRASGWRSAVQ